MNSLTGILKDRAFAQQFGNGLVRKVRPSIIGIWAFRDVLTTAGAFIVPAVMASMLIKKGMDEERAKKSGQFMSPIAFQAVLTPLHLAGFEMYNNPRGKMADIIRNVLRVSVSAMGVRMVRMGSAYGIGGVKNMTLRDQFIGWVEGEKWDESY